ncbi:MAG: aminopeptidase P family protein [Anaerolineaceae bacterium]|nr:MAG: aminopeptidase P family protein [Anaerolineaceae bacterium]
MKPKISDLEFKKRIEKTQKMMVKEGLDLLLTYGNEAEPQFVRYYSNYWPSFETAGVLIPQEGEPMLLIGPESLTYASSVSKIPTIKKLLAFRESSEPEYPGTVLETFDSVINEIMKGKKPSNIGIAGSGLITHAIYVQLENALNRLGDIEIIKADMLVAKIRAIKSDEEIACMKEAYRIAENAMKKVLESVKVGMTENQLKGIAMAAIFEQGGESEGYPFWILAGKDSNQAISRVRNKTIEKGDIVQIQVSARYEGYVSTVGRPVVMGKATEDQKALINAGLAAQKAILDTAKAGLGAVKIHEVHFNTLKELGFDDHILYGPCHGTGLMEGEYPWIESNSDYLLEENMTFCTCVYLGNDVERVGIRIEDGFIIKKDGTESFSDMRREIIEII